MTNSNKVTLDNGLARKAAGRLSMISLLAISVGIAAAPANAQTMFDPADMPMQSPVAAPQPAPAPTPQTSPATSTPAQADATPSANRADALATRGGFDATTVAPEALAQIEAEQQARKAAAAKSAAAAKAAAARTTSAPVPSAAASDGDGMDAAADTADTIAPVAGFDTAPPVIETAPVPLETVATAADPSGDNDWGLLGALAALLGIGGAAAYAATRRSKSKDRKTVVTLAVTPAREPVPAAVNAAIMPELRSDPVEAEVREALAVLPATAQPTERRGATKVAFADFVANMPKLEERRAHRDGTVNNGQRRVAAAPKPYLGEADLSRPEGYFTAHVDDMPTPQNPFLSRQKRLKRAQLLDATLAEMKAGTGNKRNQLASEMDARRKREPAFN